MIRSAALFLEKDMNILVSACLLGVACRYDGKSKPVKEVMELMKDHHLVPVCPEVFGGLSTPRNPSEIQPDRSVKMNSGKDVTAEYRKGAEEALRLAKLYDCKYALLKEKSPSCGNKEIYDGNFTGKLVSGKGITAEVLEKHGVRVFGESEIEEMVELLQ